MTDKKFTDEEVIKGLEEEIHLAEYVDSDYCCNTEVSLLKSTLDLINRQKAEIENLQNVLQNVLSNYQIEVSAKIEKQIKAEAIKAFAEKLKNKIKTECNPYGAPTFDYDTSITIMRYIDNLVKEMVGDDND